MEDFLKKIILVRLFVPILAHVSLILCFHSRLKYLQPLFHTDLSHYSARLSRGLGSFFSFPAIITNKQNFNDRFHLAGVDQTGAEPIFGCLSFSRFLRVCRWQRHTRFWILNQAGRAGWWRTRDLLLKGRVSDFLFLRNHRVSQFHSFFLILILFDAFYVCVCACSSSQKQIRIILGPLTIHSPLCRCLSSFLNISSRYFRIFECKRCHYPRTSNVGFAPFNSHEILMTTRCKSVKWTSLQNHYKVHLL